jgi:hypothetical protein
MPKHEPEVLAARIKLLNSRVTLDDKFSSYAQSLCCPRCSSSHYMYCGRSYSVVSGDIHIPFACEGCHSEFELILIENNGNSTLIEWREPRALRFASNEKTRSE